MGISYTAYIVVGAIVDDSHFYETGEVRKFCSRHGRQEKQFCGDCGHRCYEDNEKLWTPEMVRAAEGEGESPESLWERISPDGGLSAWGGKGDIGKFGRWTFGYENDDVYYGTVLCSKNDDDSTGVPHGRADPDKVMSYVAEMQEAFELFGIELPVQIFCVQDCG